MTMEANGKMKKREAVQCFEDGTKAINRGGRGGKKCSTVLQKSYTSPITSTTLILNLT